MVRRAVASCASCASCAPTADADDDDDDADDDDDDADVCACVFGWSVAICQGARDPITRPPHKPTPRDAGRFPAQESPR